MIGFILFAVACIIEACMDRLYEVYKLPLIDGEGERLNSNWFSYNPLHKATFFSFLRDGWHFLKVVYISLIIAAIVMPCSDYINIITIVAFFLIRAIVFNTFLWLFRKLITAENNFRP